MSLEDIKKSKPIKIEKCIPNFQLKNKIVILNEQNSHKSDNKIKFDNLLEKLQNRHNNLYKQNLNKKNDLNKLDKKIFRKNIFPNVKSKINKLFN